MSTFTLDEPSRIESSLAAGDMVFLMKDGKRLGIIVPTAEEFSQSIDRQRKRIERRKQLEVILPIVDKPQHVALPDFRSRIRETWGSRVFSETEVQAMRDAELEHERA